MYQTAHQASLYFECATWSRYTYIYIYISKQTTARKLSACVGFVYY